MMVYLLALLLVGLLPCCGGGEEKSAAIFLKVSVAQSVPIIRKI